MTIEITADDYLSKLEQETGIQVVDNRFVSGRLPPDVSQGMHPAEFYDSHKDGDIFSKLIEQLPEPLASPKAEFNRSAEHKSADPSNTYEDPSFS